MNDEPERLDTRLNEGVVTFYCETDDPRMLARQPDYLKLLSPEERSRHDAFRLASSRSEFLLAHALLRVLLSKASNGAPDDWSFSIEGNGKPKLADQYRDRLEFNISHTRGWVAVAMSRRWKVGVDVQHVRDRSVDDLSRHVLAPWEQAYLNGPSEDAHSDFFRFWTLKEAYLKAVGIGLSTRLKSFGFELECQPPRLRFAADGKPMSDAAFFCQEHVPGSDVKLAVGCLGNSAPPRFEFEYHVP